MGDTVGVPIYGVSMPGRKASVADLKSEEQPAAFMTLLGKVLPTTLASEQNSPPRITKIELVPVFPPPWPEDLETVGVGEPLRALPSR
jgi:hypothetical protein